MTDHISQSIVKIYRLQDKSCAKDILTTLVRIIGNIVQYPMEEKYRKLSARNKHVRSIMENEDSYAIILDIGFKKQVIQFEEVWILPHVSTIDQARLRDIHSLLSEYAGNIKLPSSTEEETPYQIEKKRKAMHEKRVNDILFQAEQDRQEVKERHERFMQMQKNAKKRKA